jgi:hypothetical protein
MFEPAEVVRLEVQLTVSTRNHAHLVDLWISMEWTTGFAEWTKEFADVVQRHSAVQSSVSLLQVVQMSEHQGWIVARGVNAASVAPSDVEALVRKVVAQVNARGHATPPNIDPPQFRRTWPERLRSTIATGSALLVGLLASPRRRDQADIASSS